MVVTTSIFWLLVLEFKDAILAIYFLRVIGMKYVICKSYW